MTDDTQAKVSTPVSGGATKGAPDGVNNAAGKTSAGGESGGGAYVNDAPKGDFTGGQSEQAYSGPGGADDKGGGGDNAVSEG